MRAFNLPDAQSKLDWRIKLEQDYALLCRNCHRKVLDPDKSNQSQIFTKAKCPYCFKSKDAKSDKKQKHQKIRIATIL